MDRITPLPTLEESLCDAKDNRLLAQLDKVCLQQVLDVSEHLSMPARSLIYEQGERIRYVYFFTSGIASASAVMHDGRSAEVACVGREGFIGLPILLDGSASLHRVWMQIAGSACRLEVGDFRRLLADTDSLEEVLRRYARARIFESAQLAACNVLHSVEQRLCRWLLLANHRTGTGQLPVTHEVLADNLGAQRTTVSLVAGNLERAGLIAYKRGHVRILNRSRMQTTACECFGAIRDRYTAMLERG